MEWLLVPLALVLFIWDEILVKWKNWRIRRALNRIYPRAWVSKRDVNRSTSAQMNSQSSGDSKE